MLFTISLPADFSPPMVLLDLRVLWQLKVGEGFCLPLKLALSYLIQYVLHIIDI
jgi:hypothetical protein